MNIVLDTNVLVSAFAFGGNSAKVLDYCIENDDLFISEWLLWEFHDVLHRKFKINEGDINHIIEIIKSEFHLIIPSTTMPLKCSDLDDNNVLQLAESSKAQFIITGDKDLLIIEKYKKIRIINPATYLLLIKETL